MSPAPHRIRAPAMLVAGASVFAALLVPNARASAPEAEVEHNEEAADERVLIRVVPGDEQVDARLRAELGLLGLDPVPLAVDESAPALGPDLLDELASARATAAIEIVLGDSRIDLWVADGNTGKALNRRLELTVNPEQGDPRTVAISAVELLRASRLELGDLGSERDNGHVASEPSDLPTHQAEESERPPRELDLPSVGAVSLAPMIGGSPGGFGVTAHIELAGRWAPLDRFALRVSAWVPTLGNSIAVTDGRVRMFVGMAFLEPQLLLPGGAKWFHPELGLGLGGAVVGFEGTAREGLRSDTRIVGGFAGYGHLGLGFAVVPRLWIRLDGFVGTVQPRPQIISPAGEIEATWGLPFATGSLGLEIWL